MSNKTPSTPTNQQSDCPNTPGPFFAADEQTQLEILFSFLNLNDNEAARNALTQLNQLTTQNVRFITMTSGPNAGERRQVYRDSNGKAYYRQGVAPHQRRVYLEDYIDERGRVRHANASERVRTQYATLMGTIQPTTLFINDVNEEKEESSVSDEKNDIIVKDVENDATL